jgi:hypothetical protein
MTDVFSNLQSAAHAGAFGMGSHAQPTPAQIKAGNYAKGSFRLHGLRITIETPMFQSRRGKEDGQPWSITCMAHYGYVNGTKGADGDAVDVFVGPAPESLRVYVVNQRAKDGSFDEHKVLLGFIDQDQACTAYMNSYEKGWTGLGSVAACTIKQFKYWLKHGDLSQPLSPDLPNIPQDEALSMTDVFARWGADNLPVGQTVGALLYEMRRTDPDGLMFDSATMADITESLAGAGEMLDAMVIEYKQFDRKAGQLLRVMQNVGGEVKAEAVEVSKPFKSKGTTQVAMLFTMSDGQSVSVFFHNPDSTPNKLMPADELISWKWIQNKRDITVVVAPEGGQDINPRIVCRRIMALIQKNSAKFVKANENKTASTAALNELKASVESKTGELAALDAKISELTAQLEQKKAAAPSAELFNDPPPPTDTRDNLARFTDALQAGDIDAALKVVESTEGVDELRELVLKAGFSLGVSATKAQIMAGVSSDLVRAAKAGVDGFGLRDLDEAPAPPVSTASTILEDYADVAALGSATVLSVGAENVYFDKDGKQYMTKLLNTDDYEARVGEVVDLSGVVDPSAAPAVDESSTILQGPAGPVTVAKTKYVETGEWAVSWASTHLATAVSKADGVAIAERVIASGADNIADMRAAVAEPVPTAPVDPFADVDAALTAIGFTRVQANDWASPALPQEGGSTKGFNVRASGDPTKYRLSFRVTFPGITGASQDVGTYESLDQLLAAVTAELKQAGAPQVEPDDGEDTGAIEAEGRDNTVKTAKGTKVVTGFKVIEAKNLVISHETDGTVNPEYPPEIQPRDRARTTSQAWVQKTARNLDPDSLGRTQRADSGAPIVGTDRVVESGNGRAMAVREAYRIGQADEYREWLLENAEYFGIDPAKIQRMKAPVLVRVRKTEVNRVEFAVESNQDDKLAMTATEKARSDAKRLDTAMLSKLADGDLNSAANRDFVAAFLQSLGDAEAAQYLTTDGKPTSGLISRLQAALFAGAYSDDRLLEMTADQAKPEIANIVSALNSAAPDFMRAKEQDRIGAEQAGEQVTDSLELSLNQEAVNAIIGATNVLRQAKEAGMGLDEFLRQGDMFGGTDPAVAAMAVFISANNRSAKRMSTAFKAMAQFVESENVRKQTAGLFGDEPASFTDIVSAANRKLEQEYGEGLFAIEQDDLFSPAPPSVTPEPPVVEPEAPNEDDALQGAKSYLDDIIGGVTDLGSPGDVLKELERIYAAYGEDKLSELFIEASDAFRDYALKATAGAF